MLKDLFILLESTLFEIINRLWLKQNLKESVTSYYGLTSEFLVREYLASLTLACQYFSHLLIYAFSPKWVSLVGVFGIFDTCMTIFSHILTLCFFSHVSYVGVFGSFDTCMPIFSHLSTLFPNQNFGSRIHVHAIIQGISYNPQKSEVISFPCAVQCPTYSLLQLGQNILLDQMLYYHIPRIQGQINLMLWGRQGIVATCCHNFALAQHLGEPTEDPLPQRVFAASLSHWNHSILLCVMNGLRHYVPVMERSKSAIKLAELQCLSHISAWWVQHQVHKCSSLSQRCWTSWYVALN